MLDEIAKWVGVDEEEVSPMVSQSKWSGLDSKREWPYGHSHNPTSEGAAGTSKGDWEAEVSEAGGKWRVWWAEKQVKKCSAEGNENQLGHTLMTGLKRGGWRTFHWTWQYAYLGDEMREWVACLYAEGNEPIGSKKKKKKSAHVHVQGKERERERAWEGEREKHAGALLKEKDTRRYGRDAIGPTPWFPKIHPSHRKARCQGRDEIDG